MKSRLASEEFLSQLCSRLQAAMLKEQDDGLLQDFQVVPRDAG